MDNFNSRWRLSWIGFFLLTLIVSIIFIRLGMWQQHRAEYKQNLVQQYEESLRQAPLEQFPRTAEWEHLRYRSAYIFGEFMSDLVIYLDNEVLDGEVGYLIHLVFRSANRYYLVDVGWLPVGQDRSQLPHFEIPRGEVKLLVRADFPLGKLPFLPQNDYSQDPPMVFPYLSLQELNQHLSYQLEPILFRVSSGDLFGTRVSFAQPNFKVDMHRSYALQWFGLAITLWAIFLILSIKRIQNLNQ